MYCALNFVDDTSLWINKNCSAYEVREGVGDLSEHELYRTKLICFNKLHFEYYHITYEFTYTMNDRSILIMAGFMELRDKIYLTFNSLGVVGVILQPSVSLTVFGVLLLITGVMFIPSIVWRLHENYKLNK